MSDPSEAYSQLLNERRADIALREKRHQSFGYLRLATFAAGLAIIYFSLAQGTLSIAWLLGPILIFAALTIVHERLLRKLEVDNIPPQDR